jgi:hypothetical protein
MKKDSNNHRADSIYTMTILQFVRILLLYLQGTLFSDVKVSITAVDFTIWQRKVSYMIFMRNVCNLLLPLSKVCKMYWLNKSIGNYQALVTNIYERKQQQYRA